MYSIPQNIGAGGGNDCEEYLILLSSGSSSVKDSFHDELEESFSHVSLSEIKLDSG